jgi:DinB superfamily
MKNSKLLALGISDSFDWLDQVVNDLTPEQYAYQPAGSANPISKLHAHTLSSADFWMKMMGLQRPMMWMTFSEKAGLPSNWIEIWKFDGEMKLEAMNEYEKLLRGCLPDVEALDDAALERKLSAPVFGRRDVAFVLRLSGTQLALHTGEISAAKGLQGLQGLPF